MPIDWKKAAKDRKIQVVGSLTLGSIIVGLTLSEVLTPDGDDGSASIDALNSSLGSFQPSTAFDWTTISNEVARTSITALGYDEAATSTTATGLDTVVVTLHTPTPSTLLTLKLITPSVGQDTDSVE